MGGFYLDLALNHQIKIAFDGLGARSGGSALAMRAASGHCE